MKPNLLLGQRFLISQEIIHKIAAAADLSGAAVLEIGPGKGALTRALAKRARRIIAVEKDARMIALLEKELPRKSVQNVRLIQGDVLKLDWKALELPEDYLVVANIPYYLTGRLIRNLLEQKHPPADIFLVVQKEVALRISAHPPEMNLLGLAVQLFANPEFLFRIPASAFSPKPKVDSAFIRITPKPPDARPPLAAAILDLARAAFRGRRKILLNSLADFPNGGKSELETALRRAGIRLEARPQELSIGEWSRIAAALGKQ